VERVRLEGGETLPADLVLVGIGVQPATALVQGLQLAQDGSIAVDASLRASEGLWAAGDIARFPDPQSGQPIRVEHWRLAQQQGRVAARAMLGLEARYEGVPFFWSEQYGRSLVYVGHATSWNQEAYWGEPETGDFVVFYGQDGHLLAASGLWRDREMAALEELMRTRRMPDFSAFQAGSFDLPNLLIPNLG
jgi:NADPH-dependent 2,4-dienoyl-CoA reductase/sulfur reductase-like enzyme